MTSLKNNDQKSFQKHIAKCGNQLKAVEIRLSFKFTIHSLIPQTWVRVGRSGDI